MLHAAHFGEHLLELEQQRQRALQMFGQRHGMELREAGKTRHDFVDLGIVLHRARAQRVELALDGEVALRQPGEMTQHFKLTELWEAVDVPAQ